MFRIALNISRSAASLRNRLVELLSLSRNKDEAFGINRKEVDFSKLAAEVAEQVSSLTLQKRQTLNVEVPHAFLTIMADDQRLEQILLNLLSNAIKFTPEGGQIYLKVDYEGNRLVVKVQDTGPGIPNEEKQKLFHPPSADNYSARTMHLPLHGTGIRSSRSFRASDAGPTR